MGKRRLVPIYQLAETGPEEFLRSLHFVKKLATLFGLDLGDTRTFKPGMGLPPSPYY